MDDPSLDDDKKPFDAETGVDDDVTRGEPDPDEHLMLDQGYGRVWLVKIPRNLLERWSAIDVEDVHLATIRVYNPPASTDPGAAPAKPRIVLFLPPNPNSRGSGPSSSKPLKPSGGSSSNAPSPSGGSSSSQPTNHPSPTPTPGTPTPPQSLSLSMGDHLPPSQRRPQFDLTRTAPTPAIQALEAQRSADEPDVYDLEIVNEHVTNQVVIAERPLLDPSSFKGSAAAAAAAAAAAGKSTRARTTILTGRIKHDCRLRPVMNEGYMRQMRERSRKYNTPKRQIRMIEDAGVAGGKGGINRLSSGVGVGSGNAFGNLIQTKQKPAKGQGERFARIPRNQLLDLIFSLYRNQPRWSIKLLREKVQQPESYLKQVLAEVATLNRSGEYNGLWELKEAFRDGGIKGEQVPMSFGDGDVKMEGVDDEMDDDEDEDEDMEEIL